MKLVIILNVNPEKNNNTKISNNREFTRRELKKLLSDGFQASLTTLFFMTILSNSKKMCLIIR